MIAMVHINLHIFCVRTNTLCDSILSSGNNPNTLHLGAWHEATLPTLQNKAKKPSSSLQVGAPCTYFPARPAKACEHKPCTLREPPKSTCILWQSVWQSGKIFGKVTEKRSLDPVIIDSWPSTAACVASPPAREHGTSSCNANLEAPSITPEAQHITGARCGWPGPAWDR
jgi:hypothetical protein